MTYAVCGRSQFEAPAIPPSPRTPIIKSRSPPIQSSLLSPNAKSEGVHTPLPWMLQPPTIRKVSTPQLPGTVRGSGRNSATVMQC